MEPTRLHTLNGDIQGLLSDRLIETTLASVGKRNVCLVQHRMNDRWDIPTLDSDGHQQTWRDAFYMCLGSDPKRSLLKLISHLTKICVERRGGFTQIFRTEYTGRRVRDLFERRPTLYAEMERLAAEMDFTWLDGGFAVYGHEPYILTCLLFEGNIESNISARNRALYDTTVANAHTILYPLLETEDLMEMLNLSSAHDSITVQPLNNLPVIHF